MVRPRTSCLAAAALALASVATGETLLLIPDTGADRIWAFSAFDGSIVSNNYIPSDGRMKQVMQVAQLPNGNIVMADPGTSQACGTDDAVLEYTACGDYVRTIAGPGDGVCNPEGICVAYGKVWFTRLYDATSEATPGRSGVWSFEYDGSGLAEFCGGPPLDKVWGLLPFDGGFLVSDSNDDNVEIVRGGCPATAPFVDSDGIVSIDFPQQIAELADGTIAVTSFSAPSGIFFFSPSGTLLDAYSSLVAPRGVYPLGNGELLYTGGTIVRAYDPANFTDRLIVNQAGASFRWIAPVERCIEDLDCSGAVNGADLGILLGNWSAAGVGDLNGTGTVDGADLGLLLSAWGACAPG